MALLAPLWCRNGVVAAAPCPVGGDFGIRAFRVLTVGGADADGEHQPTDGEATVDPSDAPLGWRVRAHDKMTIRLGAVALPLGVLLVFVATLVHPHREDVMDNRAVFMEYAQSGDWVAVHFAQWLGVLLVLGGLLGVYYVIRPTSGLGAALARFGGAAGVQAAAAFTALQAVDGVALKWGVDAWAGAPGGRSDDLFAAAEAVRWTEYAFQSFSNILLGLTLVLFGVAIALSAAYPRWLGSVLTGSGVAWIVHGAMVPYVGLFDSIPRLVAMVLLALWAFTTAALMWQTSRQPMRDHDEGTVQVDTA